MKKARTPVQPSTGIGTSKHAIPLEELSLSVRAYNSLKKHGLNTSADILALGKEELSKLKGISDKTAAEIMLLISTKASGG